MLVNLFKFLYLAGALVGGVMRAHYTRPTRQNRIASSYATSLDRLLMSLPTLGMMVAPAIYLLTPWLKFADYRWRKGWSLFNGALGSAVFTAGLWLLWRSHVDLGRNWSETLKIREEHTLVTGGVYRHIRHPMYAAHWLWGIAQTLLLQNWIAGWATLITFLPLYLVRVPQEERMMLDEFGDEYRSYMARTGRVLPPLFPRA